MTTGANFIPRKGNVIILTRKVTEPTISNFQNPIKKELSISSKQGEREIIKDASGGTVTNGAYHNAIDIRCKEKTPVYASKDGIVVSVWPSYYNGEKWKGHPIYGGLVEIEHKDGTKTRYAHLSMTEVKEKQEVKAGQEIGLSGGVVGKRGSGTSTGAHLHFEIILDIETYLER